MSEFLYPVSIYKATLTNGELCWVLDDNIDKEHFIDKKLFKADSKEQFVANNENDNNEQITVKPDAKTNTQITNANPVAKTNADAETNNNKQITDAETNNNKQITDA